MFELKYESIVMTHQNWSAGNWLWREAVMKEGTEKAWKTGLPDPDLDKDQAFRLRLMIPVF